MHLISPRLKHLLLLLTAQVGCLAIGLWGYNQFVEWSVHSAAQDIAWQQMLAQADAPQSRTRVTLVDDAWRVLPAERHSPDDVQDLAVPGEVLVWVPVEEAGAHTTAIRGLVRIDNETRAALAQARAEGGYRVFHMSTAAVKLPVSQLTAGMPLAGVITLVWVSAVLGIIVYLIITKLYDEHTHGRSQWEAQSLGQIQALQRTRDGIVFGLAKLAEFRDQETGYHLERISAFATRLAMAAGRHPKYRDQITPDFLRMIGVSSVLHDIGKVGVPDAILLKPGPLTPEERTIMQRHTLIGSNCIAEIERRLGNSNFLRMAGEIALSHHERWNGLGYPYRLAGEDIPLSARIVAMVDVYDALSSRRVYKSSMPHDECVDVIRREAGRHFDPVLVEVFLTIEAEIREIARKYSVEAPPIAPAPQLLPRWNLAREYEEFMARGEARDAEPCLVSNGSGVN